MKRIINVLAVVLLVMLVVTGSSYAWQGRMEGMGNPYGLIQDESDFLVHPALIGQSRKTTIYSHYDFTYTDVFDWDIDLDFSGAGADSKDFDASGDSHTHDALLGFAVPAGPGRFGAFFTFDGFRGEYEGDTEVQNDPDNEFEMDKDNNDFTLAFMYGLPVSTWDVGFELGLSYIDEEVKTYLSQSGGTDTTNYVWSFHRPRMNLFPYMIPYDSEYWKINAKVGAATKTDSSEIATTLRGGYILRSEHEYHYKYSDSIDAGMEGDVDGFNIGNETWFRTDLSKCLAMPLLFSIDYSETRRKAHGSDGIGTPTGYDYKHKTRNLDIKAGGGLDWEWCYNTRFGAGLYYNYLKIEEDVWFRRDTGRNRDNDKMPLHEEHRILLSLTAEKALSSSLSINTGVGAFYGFVDEDFEHISNDGNDEDDISLDGGAWGIDVSIGASIKMDQFTLEPFINAGYHQLDLDGDGDRTGSQSRDYDMDIDQDEWFVGGGFSLLFGN